MVSDRDAMDNYVSSVAKILTFGPYRLHSVQRRLWRGEHEVQLGGRAFDILLLLVERAGDVVSQRDLIEHAWPGVHVEEANLRVHIASLRKALPDETDGTRYIETVPRRGYCFVSKVQIEGQTSSHQKAPTPETFAAQRPSSLPARLARMVGRDATVRELCDLLRVHRFVTVVGAGGMGKTTVALAAAHALLDEFDGAVLFIDLGAISRGDLVEVAIATGLGIEARPNSAAADLLSFLIGKRMLLVLDNCEHVIETVSVLAERLFDAAPHLCILATSREAMRVEGENVYLLAPLDSPPLHSVLTAQEALSWPAVQLFMERAAAHGHRSPLLDEEAAIVASICHRLDGIALAIELAAGRVAGHGVGGTADLLNHRFKLLWQGRRSAVPRHQTMNAMVDWSHSLLSEQDRQILARLSIFVGTFTLGAAQEVACDQRVSAVDVADSLSSLVDKSLIWASTDREPSYRLLDMTRTFAASKLDETGDFSTVARRHALYVLEQLDDPGGARPPLSAARRRHLEGLVPNLRAALDWSFSEPRHAGIAGELAARAVPLLLSLSLLSECETWCERALGLLDDERRNTRIELALWEGLAVSMMFTRGNRPETLTTIERGLSLAHELGSHDQELRLLSGLHLFNIRIGDFASLMGVSLRALALAEQHGSADALVMVEWMLGTACHLGGNQADAQRYCESALQRSAASGATYLDSFGYDHRVRGLIVLARVLWLRGFFDRAARISKDIVAEAERNGQPVALCIALIYTNTVAMWSEDLITADDQVVRLIARASASSLEPYRATGLAMRAEMLVLRGQLHEGISGLREAISILETERHRILTTGYLRTLAEALAKDHQEVEAMAALDRATAQAAVNGESYMEPDLLRARGEILAAAAVPDLAAAEHNLREAVALAREYGTLGWEVRATRSLARFLAERGRREEAIWLLEPLAAEYDDTANVPLVKSISDLLTAMRRLD